MTFLRTPAGVLTALGCTWLALAPLTAHAEPGQTLVWGGQPRVAFELEYEESPDGREQAVSATLIPGLQWKEGWINRAEILLQGEREREKEDGLTSYETERKVAVRLRKNLRFSDSLRGYVRVLVGRAFGETRQYDYAYAEPALTYRFEHAAWTAGYRFVRAIDGTEGRDTDRFRLGPSFDLDAHRELEFRWVRSWDARTREHRADAWIVEFVYKY